MKIKVINCSGDNTYPHLVNTVIDVTQCKHYYYYKERKNDGLDRGYLINFKDAINWEDYDTTQLKLNLDENISQNTLKNDDGKTQYSDIPVKTLRSVAKAFNYGAKKYSKFNYTKGMEWLRYTDACQRHLESWKEFEDIDAESGSNHIDNAIASLMMLRENIHLNKGIDNRNQDYKQIVNNK